MDPGGYFLHSLRFSMFWVSSLVAVWPFEGSQVGVTGEFGSPGILPGGLIPGAGSRRPLAATVSPASPLAAP